MRQKCNKDAKILGKAREKLKSQLCSHWLVLVRNSIYFAYSET